MKRNSKEVHTFFFDRPCKIPLYALRLAHRALQTCYLADSDLMGQYGERETKKGVGKKT